MSTATRPRHEAFPPMSTGTLAPLARLEARRFATHPLFVVSMLIGAPLVYLSVAADADNLDRLTNLPSAFFLGLPSMLVAYFLTTSARRSYEVADVTPTGAVTRSAALCLACLVPTGVGVVSLAFALFSFVSWPLDDWQLGTMGGPQMLAYQVSTTLVPVVGAALLGVVAGQWLRFRGAATALVLGVLTWVVASQSITVGLAPVSTPVRVVHLVTPYALFTEGHLQPPALGTIPGSPAWFLGWQVALCALAALGALAHGAFAATRARLRRLVIAAGSLALVLLVLAIALGPSYLTMTYSDGRTLIGR